MSAGFENPKKVQFLQRLFEEGGPVDVEGHLDRPQATSDDDGWIVVLDGEDFEEHWVVSDLNLDQAKRWGNTGIQVPFKNFDEEIHESEWITITFLQERVIIDPFTIEHFLDPEDRDPSYQNE